MGTGGLLHGSRVAIRASTMLETFESTLTTFFSREDVHRLSEDLELFVASPQSTIISFHTSQTLSLERHLMRSCLRGYKKYGGF
jgi:hypothetical protein